jgi:hypothetical protein
LAWAVPAIIAQLFRPPARFADDVEAEFRAETEARAAPARQTGLILLLLMWVSYFGWDTFHSYRNQDFRPSLEILLELRLAGTACILITGVSLLLFRGRRRAGVAAVAFGHGARYLR